MDKLGLECVVQYKDVAGGKKIRHTRGRPVMTQVEFIQEQFAKMTQSPSAKAVE